MMNKEISQIYTETKNMLDIIFEQREDEIYKNNIIHVKRTLTRILDKKVIMGNTTKTFSGIRDVPIQEFILEEVNEQMKIAKNNFDGQLFISSKGKYADPKAANKILKRIMVEVCHVNDITTHCLRHTFGTRCIESGMTPVVVQRILGHKDIRVTLNIYTSVLNKFKEDKLKKLDDYYNNQGISKVKDFKQKNTFYK